MDIVGSDVLLTRLCTMSIVVAYLCSWRSMPHRVKFKFQGKLCKKRVEIQRVPAEEDWVSSPTLLFMDQLFQSVYGVPDVNASRFGIQFSRWIQL